MSGRFEQLKTRAGLLSARRLAELNRTPQRAPSRWEIVAYAALPVLLGLAGAFPTAALFLLPIILSLLYLCYRRLGIYLPLMCVISYGVLSLCFNFDILTVIFFCALVFGLFGVVMSCCVSPYLAGVAIAAAATVVGAIIGVAAVRISQNKSIGDIAAEYVISHENDSVIVFFARDYYASYTPSATESKLKPSDAGYDSEATAKLAEWAADDYTRYVWYYCIHYGGLFGCAAFFVATFINRRTLGAYDHGVTEKELVSSTRAMGGIRGKPIPIGEMKLPRVFLLCCVLPAFIASVVLYAVGGYDFLTSTVTHTFITLPAAFGCVTLLAFFAGLAKGKGRIVAYIAVCVVGAAAVLFPLVLFALSVLGLCDSVLDLRYWTRFIMSE